MSTSYRGIGEVVRIAAEEGRLRLDREDQPDVGEPAEAIQLVLPAAVHGHHLAVGVRRGLRRRPPGSVVFLRSAGGGGRPRWPRPRSPAPTLSVTSEIACSSSITRPGQGRSSVPARRWEPVTQQVFARLGHRLDALAGTVVVGHDRARWPTRTTPEHPLLSRHRRQPHVIQPGWTGGNRSAWPNRPGAARRRSTSSRSRARGIRRRERVCWADAGVTAAHSATIAAVWKRRMSTPKARRDGQTSAEIWFSQLPADAAPAVAVTPRGDHPDGGTWHWISLVYIIQ